MNQDEKAKVLILGILVGMVYTLGTGALICFLVA